MSMKIEVPAGYEALGAVLGSAVSQAAKGKGVERHGGYGEPFHEQQICEIQRRVGGGFCQGQAVKKIYEADVLDGDRAVAELLGAINYLAAAVIVLREAYGEEEDETRDYRPGDSVQFRGHVGKTDWTDARYERELPSGCGHIVLVPGFGRIAVDPENIRHAPLLEEEE